MAETNASNRCSRQMKHVYCFADKVKRFPGLARRATWKVGKDDPRRVVHAFKVGLALTLVSLLYLMEPLFNGIGKNAMWAVMTVVVVMEFTVGATLSKGLNRGLGTLLAGSLAFLVEYIAEAPGRIFRAIFIGLAVFLLESDDDSSEDLIYDGYKTVLDSKASDETLALQASWEPRYARYCYKIPWHQYAKIGAALRHFSYTVVALHGCLKSEIKRSLKLLRAGSCVSDLAIIFRSSPSELNHTNDDCDKSFQTPKSIRALYEDSCIRLGEEVSKVLRELANSIRNNRQFSPETLSNNLKEALEDLDDALKSQPQLVLGSRNSRTTNTPFQAVPHPDKKLEDTRTTLSSVKNIESFSLRACKSKDHTRELSKKALRPQPSMAAIVSLEFSDALPFAAFTSLLVEMVAKLDRVMDEVEQLGRMAHFREFEDDDGDEVVVACEKPKMNIAQNDLPPYTTE
ncbi:unnamed protein product [Sphenostylis stenocarpa]|uniref:Aluminum-activated malate transporter n=1 Tax=Sphenostylis stenocarpa TaxID=92480 RepID=A0AA86W3G6_9FABA|nr:unnamed protein product [Sphenostylis stenocarpa]